MLNLGDCKTHISGKTLAISYPLCPGLCGMWQKEDQCFFSSGHFVELPVAGLKFTAGAVKCGPSIPAYI